MKDTPLENGCNPSPCGQNSQCDHALYDDVLCSCLVGYVGVPPNCRHECSISSDCAAPSTCIDHRCVDPCNNKCGVYADCHEENGVPICKCRDEYIGNPNNGCYHECEFQFECPSNKTCVGFKCVDP